MGVLEDVKDVIAIGLMIGMAYIVYRLATEGPRAVQETVGRIVEQVREHVEVAVKEARERVEWVKAETRYDVRKCIGYIHEAYGLTWQVPGWLKTSIKKFCIALAKATQIGIVTPAKVYEDLWYRYMYNVESGMSKTMALKKALDSLASQLEEMIQMYTAGIR